jgi:hypothetical protein
MVQFIRSFRTRKLDIYNIDALENSDTFCLDVNDLMYLFENFQKWNVIQDCQWVQFWSLYGKNKIYAIYDS